MKAHQKMISLRISYISLFILFSFQVFAQKDYRPGFILGEKGDTTFGYLDYKESVASYEHCEFKNSLSSEIKVYNPNEIAGYGFENDKVFIARDISNDSLHFKKAFIEVLVKGKISLYLHKGKYYIEKDNSGLYILQNEEKEIEKNGTMYIKKTVKNAGILQLFVADCHEVKSHLKTIAAEGKILAKIVLDYNNCGRDTVIEYNATKRWTKINLGLSLGFQMTKLNFISDYASLRYLTDNKYSHTTLLPTIYLDFSSPKLYERLFFQIGVSYLKRNFYSDKKTESGSSIQRDENYIGFSTIKLPLAFKYQFPGKKIRPHFLIGAVPYITTGSKSWRILEREVKGTNNLSSVYTYKGESHKMKAQYFGVHAGIGVSKTIGKRLVILIEGRYEVENTSTYLFNYESIKLKVNSFNLNAGVVF